MSLDNSEVFDESERDDLIVLVDEDGKEMEFEYLITIPMHGSEYVVLLPIEDSDKEQVDEVVILKIELFKTINANGEEVEEETFVSVDDETELNSVFQEFKRKIKEQYDAESNITSAESIVTGTDSDENVSYNTDSDTNTDTDSNDDIDDDDLD